MFKFSVNKANKHWIVNIVIREVAFYYFHKKWWDFREAIESIEFIKRKVLLETKRTSTWLYRD